MLGLWTHALRLPAPSCSSLPLLLCRETRVPHFSSFSSWTRHVLSLQRDLLHLPSLYSRRMRSTMTSVDPSEEKEEKASTHTCPPTQPCETSCNECPQSPCVHCPDKQTADSPPSKACWSCRHFMKRAAYFCNACNAVQPIEEDYFEILGLPREFDVDARHLENRFRSLQRMLHPDLFGTKSQQEQRISAAASAAVNQAYQTLRDAHRRAVYLLGLYGIDVGETGETLEDPELLMEVMEMHEAIEEAGTNMDVLRELYTQNKERERATTEELIQAFRIRDLDAARTAAVRLQYWHKIERELHEQLPT